MSPPLVVSADEMETAVRIFSEAVAAVAAVGDDGMLSVATAAGAINAVEAAI
jgi:hypothetical protein